MRYDQFSEDSFVFSKLRRRSMYAARRALMWMVFILTFTILSSVIAMFEFVNSGTASPTLPGPEWTLDTAENTEFLNNPASPGWK